MPLVALESAIESLSPGWALARARARARARVFNSASTKLRRYEAGMSGRRFEGWKSVTGASANAEIAADAIMVRNRSRDLARNNCWAVKGINVIQNNVIGAGIIPAFDIKAQGKREDLRKLWQEWGETTKCDARGRTTFYGLEGLILRTVAESGEAIILRHWLRPEVAARLGLPLPLQLSVLEPDYIDSGRNLTTFGLNANSLIFGIEVDPYGRREGYWLYDQHPGSPGFTAQSYFVPASEVIHVFREDRPGQMRGIPWLAPVVLRLKDFDDYQDGQVLRQKIASYFGAFVVEPDADAAMKDATYELYDTLEAGAVEILPPGKDIRFSNPPATEGVASFSEVILHGIAAGLCVPYEALTGDWAKVNFSSGRMGRLEFNRNLDAWQWSMVIPQFCDAVVPWFLQAAELYRDIDPVNVNVRWVPPRRELVDPVREIPMLQTAVRSGFQSLSQTIREYGYEPDQVLKELADDFAMADRLGIVLDVDPRRVAKAGVAQTVPPALTPTDIPQENP